MKHYSDEQLKDLGATNTANEIFQQPSVWQEALENYQENYSEITAFLDEIKEKHDYIKVIFTGAGTSAFVGETLFPYFVKTYDEKKWQFKAIPTTDIVATPEYYLQKDVPTILVSFARSGNSPESVACVELANQFVETLYHIPITCAKDGYLAKQAEGDENTLLLLQPDRSNDLGFAMTSSFSSMFLTALLVFDQAPLEEKVKNVETLIALAEDVLEKEEEILAIIQEDFNRVVYLGAGPFFGLSHEAQLKILELTAGKIATLYETPVGFRHGPKSFIDEKTLVFVFGSVKDYTKQYDIDLVTEVASDQIAKKVIYLSDKEQAIAGVENIVINSEHNLEDIYRVLPYIVYAQIVSLLTSLKIENKPDTPSPSGTVNRVVQGVVIHQFED